MSKACSHCGGTGHEPDKKEAVPAQQLEREARCDHPLAVCVGRTGQAQLLRLYRCPECFAEWADDCD